MVKVLFVCLGNICRSPLAEAVFRHQVEKLGLESHFELIYSAGTAGYHVGCKPDGRSLAVLSQNGIETKHKARQVKSSDFIEFDYVLCMDESNLSNCLEIAGKGGRAKVQLFGDYGGGEADRIIEDPYYGGKEGFELNFQQVGRCTDGFLKSLKLI